MEEINKIHLIFKDFEPIESESVNPFNFVNILTQNYIPPAYMVQIILSGILGFKNYGRMDKVWWYTYFRYKKHTFMIGDYKFGSWAIEGLRNDREILQLAKEIQKKIIKASKIIDKVLYNELKLEIASGNFYLNNFYHKLKSIYDFYEEKVLETIKECENFKKEIKKSQDISYVIKNLNIKLTYNKTLSKFSFALILSFFSLLEFLFDVIYAFEQPHIPFLEFKKKTWDDRFKIIFPINKDKDLKSLYDKLKYIKDDYRNPLAHGLINESSLLFPLPHIGLVPLSYGYISKKIYYGYVEIEKEDILRVLNVFRAFLDFMDDNESYKFYLLYLKFGFPIPLNGNEIFKIKKKMTTYEKFKKYLENEANYYDMLINRDI